MALVDRDVGGHIVTRCSSHRVMTLLSSQQKASEVYKNPTGVRGELQGQHQ